MFNAFILLFPNNISHKTRMKKLETILTLTILAALTAQASPSLGLPGYDECIADGGSPETVEVPQNESDGPFSDRPIFKVICHYPVSSRCDDGTMQGDCSETKPFLCYSTKGLVARCDKCGCPEGELCETRTCVSTTSTSSTTSTTTTSTSSSSSTTTTLSSTTSSSTSLHVYTTSSTIAETTSTSIGDVPEDITGRFALTRGRGALLAAVLVFLIGYALVKFNPSSRDAS